jgi:conjugative relaxase-like TrwC/TraI family protein
MVSINPITNPSQAASYFRRDDYYVRDKEESPSAWHGKGAMALGLSGEVHRDEFSKMLEGRLPTGDTLGRINVEGERKHKPGYDLTFSSPKSVSVLALPGGDQRLVEAHREAVKTALDWVERHHAVTRVKISGQTHLEHTGNLVIAAFHHETSRALDPQLHTHCVIFNCTQRGDSAWRSIEGREIMLIQKEADRIYQSELAVRIQPLGYEVELDREKGRIELAAVPPEVRGAFSQRSQAIEAKLEINGKTRETASAAEREVACLATRDKKMDLDRAMLREQWLIRARELDFDPEKTVAEAQTRSDGLLRQAAVGQQAEVERAVRSAVEHLAERSASFRASDLDQILSSKFFGDYRRAEMDQAIERLRERRELIPKEVRSLWDSRKLEVGYTTPQGQNIERQMLAAAKRGRGAFDQGITSPEKAREAITAAQERGKWNDQLKQATEGILTSHDRFVAIQGVAGSAKTSRTVRTVAEVSKAVGYEVRGLAPSATGAHTLEDGAGIASQTVHSFLGELRQVKINIQLHQDKEGQTLAQNKSQEPPKLWTVDEAGMVGAKQVRDLLKAAESHNARVLLVGDVRQLGSVEAGQAFAQVQEHMQTYHIETILRQRDSQLREAVTRAYQGEAAKALDKIRDRGGLIEIANPGSDRVAGLVDRSQAIAAEYLALSPEERYRTLVIAPGHDDREAINQTIRDGLIAQGAVKQNGFEASTLERKGLTQAEIKNPHRYTTGEIVRFGRGYASQGIGKSSYWEVVGVDGKTVRLTREGEHIEWNPAHHSKVEVYRAVNRELGEGDLIIFNKNDKEAGLLNGQTAVVQQLDGSTGQTQVVTREGEVREVNLQDNPHWSHGYAITAHAAQGATADLVLIHAESHRANLTTQRSLYVGISRARDEVKIFTDDAAKLKEAVELRSGEKEIAMEPELARPEREQDYSLSR